MKERLIRWSNKPAKHKLASISANFKHVLFRVSALFLNKVFVFAMKRNTIRKLAYRSLPKNTLLVAKTPVESFIVNSSDITIGSTTFVQRTAFESSKLLEVLALMPEDHSKEIIVDIGANIGTICIHAVANNHFKRGIAFEPEPECFRLLKSNVALNNLEESICLHNLALSNKCRGVIELEIAEENHGDHRVRVSLDRGLFNEENRATISVRSDVLDNYSANFHRKSTLIWIDTQGFEGLVFSGGKSVINQSIPICMEFWPYGLKRSGCFEGLIELFSNAPYRTLLDLNNPITNLELNREQLEAIARQLGDEGEFTDLLLI